jgi:hypothetical protein
MVVRCQRLVIADLQVGVLLAHACLQHYIEVKSGKNARMGLPDRNHAGGSIAPQDQMKFDKNPIQQYAVLRCGQLRPPFDCRYRIFTGERVRGGTATAFRQFALIFEGCL